MAKAERTQFEPLNNWDLFVLRHQDMRNVAVHFLSCVCFWLSPVAAILWSSWFWIGFFISGLIGTFGHWIFQDGTVDRKEATSSWRVVVYSTRMALLFLSVRYPHEVRRSRKKFDLFKCGEIKSEADLEMFQRLPTHLQKGFSL